MKRLHSIAQFLELWRKRVFRTAVLAPCILFASLKAEAGPICLHPDNPRWFEWHGKGAALITSAEHYGAVLNLDFDYRKYLETLERDGMNYTRVFAGSYSEPPGAFGIERNSLAPAPGRFLAPWARSDQPGHSGGGNKFDLERFSPDYLSRLKGFLGEADKRGIVVELTLFCSTYSDMQWAIHPLNPENNIQAYPVDDFKAINTTRNSPEIMQAQEQMVRWLVRELNDFDNLFYEIQNEPWADNSTMGDPVNPYMVKDYKWPNACEIPTPESVNWQRAIAEVISDEESLLPKKHLIAQNITNFQLAVSEEDLVPGVSVMNFHYAYPAAVEWNRGFPGVVGYDETGFAGSEDRTYRRQAWNFVMSGGGLFNNLDYSFSVGFEDGMDTGNKAPGGGSAQLRQQLRVLSGFIHGFELEKLNPDPDFVQRAPGVLARVLSEPGQQYALYLEGRAPRQIEINLPCGTWGIEWIDVKSGASLGSGKLKGAGQPIPVHCPAFVGEVAVEIIKD